MDSFKTVLLIANSGFTIVNFRTELIRKLVSMGCQVIVVCPKVCPLMLGRSIEDELSKLGARYSPIELSRSGTDPIADLRLLYSLWKILRNETPDAVLNYTVKPSIYGSIAAWLAGVRTISSNITGIGSILVGRSLKAKVLSALLKLQYRLALRLNSIVFFQNPDDKQFFEESGLIRGTRTKIINGSGVDIERFSRGNFEPNEATFVFVGRLLEGKGIREYIRAAEVLKRKYPEAVFTVLGDTDENPESLSLGEVAGYNDAGIITYHQSVKDVRPILEKHQVLVLPSRREGTPRSILEALSMSMAVVTTDAPGCRETVEDGVNGYLVEFGNVLQLVEAMERLILDPKCAATFGARSRDIACSKYDVRKVVDSILVELPLSTPPR